MANKNYYELLGVSKDASPDEIKSAYRRQAKKYHPDLYAGKSDSEKKEAEEMFKQVSFAYEVLSNEDKRAKYDTYGDENAQQGFGNGGFGGFGGAGGFDVDDIFSSIFQGFGGAGGARQNIQNQPQKGRDILLNLKVNFEDAVFGAKKTINVKRVETCATCGGSGASPNSGLKVCPQCGGSGMITQTQRTPFGQFSTQTTCPHCKGKGKVIVEPCRDCNGAGRYEKVREITVNIPAGINTGQRITYQGEGHAGINGGPKGNLIVEITACQHKYFVRNEYDINLDVPISVFDATLGTTIDIPTLTGVIELKIPEGTQSGTVFRIKHKGVKKLRGVDKGDMLVKVVVETPRSLSKQQKELLKKVDESFDEKQFQKIKEYKTKITSN